MSYQPLNAVVYSAAYAGALAALSPGINSFAATTYANVAQAYAQEFDTLWGSTAASQADTNAIFGSSFLFFMSRLQGPTVLKVTANTTNPSTYSATCRALISVIQIGQGVLAPFVPPFLFLPPSISIPAGQTKSFFQAPVNNVTAISTGAQSTLLLPAAPVDGDVVVAHLLGASVSNPLLVTARGGYAIEIPSSPGNFTAINGTTSMTGVGQCTWWQFNLAQNKWTLIVNFTNTTTNSGVIAIRIPIALVTVSSATSIPIGAIITNARLDVTTPYSSGTTISLGQAGSVSEFMPTGDNTPGIAGYYEDLQDTSAASTNPLLVTIAGGPAAGAGFAIVEYLSNPLT